ncbi:MAG: hypothetical protein ACNA8W_04050 [Bradymonadaceae bacterium]
MSPSQRPENPDGEDSGDDSMIDDIARAEGRRRLITLVMGVVVLVSTAVALWAIFAHRDTFFRPQMDIAAGEGEVLADTNDPVCRNVITDVTAAGEDFFKIEADIEAGLLAGSPETVAKTVDALTLIRTRLEEVQTRSQDANLRFDESRTQLDQWFTYTHNELTLLERLGNDHRDVLEPRIVEEAEAEDAEEAAEAPKDKAAPARPATELRDQALLAVHESFQNFRVWHTSGLHPCGVAPEGREPWTP